MTNEKKAREIANDDTLYGEDSDNNSKIDECYIAALKMAEYKDEQIDITLLTMEGCLRSFFESKGNTQESIDNFINAIKAQIDNNLSEL